MEAPGGLSSVSERTGEQDRRRDRTPSGAGGFEVGFRRTPGEDGGAFGDPENALHEERKEGYDTLTLIPWTTNW